MGFKETHWKLLKLGDALNFKRGHDLPKKNMNGGTYPVVGSNGIIGYHDQFTTDSPCLTIGRSGNIGTPHIYLQKCWAHNTTLYVDDFKGNSPEFLYYLLKTMNLSHYGGGSAVPTLNRNHLHPIEIMFPRDIKIQKAIAHILLTLDEKIEVNNQINKTLEEMAQTIFKRWFVDFEFPNEDGEPYKSSGGEMVESELGLIPKGWEVVSLYSLAEYINGTSYKKGEINESEGLPIIKIAELKQGYTSSTKYYYSESTKPDKYYLKNGDILFSWSGNPETSIDTFIWYRGDGILNQHIFKVLPYNFSSEFMYVILKYFKPIFTQIATNKQTTGLGHVTVNDLKRLKMPLPKDKFIEDYTKVFIPIIKKLHLNDLGNNKLKQLRDTLLPKLMFGEIRVPIK